MRCTIVAAVLAAGLIWLAPPARAADADGHRRAGPPAGEGLLVLLAGKGFDQLKPDHLSRTSRGGGGALWGARLRGGERDGGGQGDCDTDVLLHRLLLGVLS